VSAVGVLGGTFDPVHRGHLALAAGVREALGLAQVLLVPCATPPHKPGRAVTAAYHRLEMLYLGCEGRERLSVGTQELARGGVSYTIDTLRELRAGGADPVFVVGSDSLAEMGAWRSSTSPRSSGPRTAESRSPRGFARRCGGGSSRGRPAARSTVSAGEGGSCASRSGRSRSPPA